MKNLLSRLTLLAAALFVVSWPLYRFGGQPWALWLMYGGLGLWMLLFLLRLVLFRRYRRRNVLMLSVFAILIIVVYLYFYLTK